MYRDDMTDDLQRYFDFYAKGVQNGWEDITPPVRVSLLGFETGGGATETIVERAETSYPLEREQLKTFYLDTSKRQLVGELSSAEHSASYEAHHLTDSLVSALLEPGTMND